MWNYQVRLLGKKLGQFRWITMNIKFIILIVGVLYVLSFAMSLESSFRQKQINCWCSFPIKCTYYFTKSLQKSCLDFVKEFDTFRRKITFKTIFIFQRKVIFIHLNLVLVDSIFQDYSSEGFHPKLTSKKEEEKTIFPRILRTKTVLAASIHFHFVKLWHLVLIRQWKLPIVIIINFIIRLLWSNWPRQTQSQITTQKVLL